MSTTNDSQKTWTETTTEYYETIVVKTEELVTGKTSEQRKTDEYAESTKDKKDEVIDKVNEQTDEIIDKKNELKEKTKEKKDELKNKAESNSSKNDNEPKKTWTETATEYCEYTKEKGQELLEKTKEMVIGSGKTQDEINKEKVVEEINQKSDEIIEKAHNMIDIIENKHGKYTGINNQIKLKNEIKNIKADTDSSNLSKNNKNEPNKDLKEKANDYYDKTKEKGEKLVDKTKEMVTGKTKEQHKTDKVIDEVYDIIHKREEVFNNKNNEMKNSNNKNEP